MSSETTRCEASRLEKSPPANEHDGESPTLPKKLGSEPPDGGTTAWVVVFGAWCASFCSFGWVNSTQDSLQQLGTCWTLTAVEASASSRNITKTSFFETSRRVSSPGFRLSKSSSYWAWCVMLYPSSFTAY